MASDEGRGGTKVIVLLVGSVLLGIVALGVVYKLIQGYQQQILMAQKPDDTVMVIVAARDLYQGIEITEEDLYAVEIPPEFLHEAVYQSPEHVVGRIPRERILANEFLREERLADLKSGIGLNAIIPRGSRAISINVQDAAGLSGFLNPSNYVDMLVTIKPEGSQAVEDIETRTILQAAYVLAVDSRMQQLKKIDPDDPTGGLSAAQESRQKLKPSVTISVSPEEAEQVAYSEQRGKVTLTLRNDLDIEPIEFDEEHPGGVTVRDITGEVEETAVTRPTSSRPTSSSKPAPAPKCYITVIKAGKQVQIPTPCN